MVRALFASLEGVLLIVLFVRGRGRLKNVFKLGRRHAYIIFSLVYSLIFIYAFSAIGNFAIVGRQRAQLFPFVFVFLALPAAAQVKRPARRHRSLVAASNTRRLHR